MHHLGDPCIHCGQPHDDVAPGPCPKATGLAATVRNIEFLSGHLAAHKAAAKKETERLEQALAVERTKMAQSEAGLDLDKISLAESVMFATDYSRAGQDRDSARQAAIQWFAGQKVGYRGLRYEFFGTKNYDRWSGQRCDCEYNYGPSHGSICFSIGLKQPLRGENGRDLTDSEREAAVYYLVNLERIQAARVAPAAA